MSRHRASVLFAAICAVSLVAAGCGDDDGGEPPTVPELPDPGVTPSDDPATDITDPSSEDDDATDPSGGTATTSAAPTSTTTLLDGPLDPSDPGYPTIPPRPSVTYPSAG